MSALIVGDVWIGIGGRLRRAGGAQVDPPVEWEGVEHDADRAVCVVEPVQRFFRGDRAGVNSAGAVGGCWVRNYVSWGTEG